jgi:hypothetical protein
MYPIPPPPQGYPGAGLYNNPNFDSLTHAQINMPPMGHHHQHQHHQQNQHQHQHHGGFQSLNSQAAFPTLPVTSSSSAGAAGVYMSAAPQPQTNAFMTMASDIEPFPALSMDALGLHHGMQDPSVSRAGVGVGVGGQLPYGGAGSGNGLMDAAAQGLAVDHHHLQQQQQQQQQHQQQQFTPQGSVSPYGRSPNVGQGGFY